jgi:LPXTG-motif cell wall-anchored protein
VADGTEFTFQLSCQVLVNGEVLPVELQNDGVVTLTTPGDLTAQFDGLPSGANCIVAETGDGGADSASISPGEVTVGVDAVADVLAVNTFDPEVTNPPPNPPGEDPPGWKLPSTGGPGLGLTALGALLLGAGGGLLWTRRRRGRR